MMSELFMECVEEELEPWQKPVPQVHLIDDDDDEPIFVGVLSNNQKDDKPNPIPKKSAVTEIKCPPPHPAVAPPPVVLPLSVPVTKVTTASSNLTTVAPQPVIVNNQGFIVASSHLTNNELIATLGSQFPPGTSFTILPAPQQQLFHQITPAIQGGVHRPQVQQINNNIVTLSNVQSPAVYSTPQQPKLSNSQSLQTTSVKLVPAKDSSINKDHSLVKRRSTTLAAECVSKKGKFDLTPAKVMVKVENGIKKRSCPKCQEEFATEEAQKFHVMCCRGNVGSLTLSTPRTAANKLIMLVADFYYGHFEGDEQKKEAPKTNSTFKCQSCLKVLKNNVRNCHNTTDEEEDEELPNYRTTKEEKLIVAVCAWRELYDPWSLNYRNRTLKDKAWSNISDEVGLPPDRCRQRWKSLRDVYMREKRKEAEKKSSSARGPLKKCKYSTILSFLDPFFAPREMSGNMNASLVEDTTEEDNPQPREEEEETAATDLSAVTSDLVDHSEPGSPSPESESLLGPAAAAAAASTTDTGPSSSTAGHPGSQRKSKQGQEKPVNLDSQVHLALEAVPLPLPQPPSETKLFFGCISKMVKRLPQLRRDAVKFNIYKIVYEALSAEENN